jgi:HEAT repeat protein
MMRTTTSSGGSCRNAMQSIGNLGMLLVHEPNLLPIRLSAVASLQNIAIQQPFTTETVRAITALVTGLYSRSPLVRQRCILALGKSRYSTVISALREAVKDNGESTSLRVTALRGLGFGRTSVVETEVMIQLLTLAYNEENESKTIRDAAEVTAARLGWERSLQHEANIDV